MHLFPVIHLNWVGVHSRSVYWGVVCVAAGHKSREHIYIYIYTSCYVDNENAVLYKGKEFLFVREGRDNRSSKKNQSFSETKLKFF